MQKLKQFWILYLLYAWELSTFMVVVLLTYMVNFHPDILARLDEQSATVLIGISGAWIFLVFPAPVIFGFFFRFYFLHGIWVTYAWLFSATLLIAVSEGDLSNIDWSFDWVFLVHPILVTFALTFSSAAHEYFNKGQPIEGKPINISEEDIWQRDRRFSAEDFLEMRLGKHPKCDKLPSQNQFGWVHVIWIGIAMIMWNWIFGIGLLGRIGIGVCVMGFIMARGVIKSSLKSNA